MSNKCLTCGGFIMDSSKNYSYAGKVCYCLVEPRIQKRASDNKEYLDLCNYLGIKNCLSDSDLGEITLSKQLTQAQERIAELEERLKEAEKVIELANELIGPEFLGTDIGEDWDERFNEYQAKYMKEGSDGT